MNVLAKLACGGMLAVLLPAVAVSEDAPVSSPAAVELGPRSIEEIPGGGFVARYSDRTLVVAVEIDRDQARLIRYTVKPRPYIQPYETIPVRTYDEHRPVQLEVILHGAESQRYIRRVDVPFLCLSHPGEARHRE